MNLHDFRQNYTLGGLRRHELEADPIIQFQKWFAQAVEAGYTEPNAMSLSTVNAKGIPFQRIVLLKAVNECGFEFFGNYESRKAQHMEQHPVVSLLFPWITLQRQVMVIGKVEPITQEESRAYFAVRPRESQLGAWASHQSSTLESRLQLEKNFADLSVRFDGEDIPMPDNWGGWRVKPEIIEFWQGGASRLHDRFLYEKSDNSWKISRLSP